MKLKINKKITLGIIFIFALLVTSGVALAFEKMKLNIAPQNDFVVEPGKTEIFINAGETVTKSISITNRIGKSVKFKLTTEDIIGTNDSISPVKLLGDDIGPYS